MSGFPPVVRQDWLGAPDGLALIPDGSVTTPGGFVAGGVACGLKASGARDLGVVRATRPAVSWLLDTTNALPSAPVRLNRTRDRSGFQAVVVNAGIANAATGPAGDRDARRMSELVAAELDLAPEQVVVSSTGVIGERLHMDRIAAGIPAVCAALSGDGGRAFNEAICTTDRAVKGGAFRLPLDRGVVQIGIAAKGAGMIRPTMATMLAYVTTDAAVAAADLEAITRRAGAGSFNRISVDGQMSPSDTLLVMASGGGPPLSGDDLGRVADAILAVCRWAAIQIVKDGEGAEHAVRVMVRDARDADEAERVARAIGDSPLVKTAIFGRDPNWGRISQAVGHALAGAPELMYEPAVLLDGMQIGAAGARAVMALAEYDIEVALGRGGAQYDLWVSDLTHAYVTLNAEYHT